MAIKKYSTGNYNRFFKHMQFFFSIVFYDNGSELSSTGS